MTEGRKQELNHRSGSGRDVTELRHRFMFYLTSHGVPGEWLPGKSRTDMMHATKAWDQFGKRVADPVLDQLVAEGVVEIRSTPNGMGGRQVRVNPKWLEAGNRLPLPYSDKAPGGSLAPPAS